MKAECYYVTILRLPPAKATCCCVAVLRVPPVKATRCFVTVLRVPPVKATCCFVFSSRFPLVSVACCCMTVFARTSNSGNLLLWHTIMEGITCCEILFMRNKLELSVILIEAVCFVIGSCPY